MQTILLVPCSGCLTVLLAAVQRYNVSVFRSLDMSYFSFASVSIPVWWVTHISNLPTVNIKMILSSPPFHPVFLQVQKWAFLLRFLCRKRGLVCSRSGLFNFRLLFVLANCLGIVLKIRDFRGDCLNFLIVYKKKVHHSFQNAKAAENQCLQLQI